MPSPSRRSAAEAEVQDYLSRVRAGQAGQNPVDQTLARSTRNPIASRIGQQNMADRTNENLREIDRAAREQEALAEDQAREAEAAAKAAAKAQETARTNALNFAEKSGMVVEEGIDGTRDVARHADGAPKWTPGNIGGPEVVGQARTAIQNEDGTTRITPNTDIMLGQGGVGNIGETGIPSGTKSQAVFGQAKRDDRGNVTVAPVETKTDAKTGKMTVASKDAEGKVVKLPAGVDWAVRERAARQQATEEELAAVDLRANELAQQRLSFEPQFEPAKKERDEAKAELARLGQPHFQRGGAWYAVTSTGSERLASPDEVARAKALRQQAQARLDRAEAAYRPLEGQAATLDTAEREIKSRKLQLEADKIRLANGLPVDDGGLAKILSVAEQRGTDPEMEAVAAVIPDQNTPPEQAGPPNPVNQSPDDLALFRGAFSAFNEADKLTLGAAGTNYRMIRRNGVDIGSVERDRQSGVPVVVIGKNANATADLRGFVAFGATTGIPLYAADSPKRKSLTQEAAWVAGVFDAASPTPEQIEAYGETKNWPEGTVEAIEERLKGMGATPEGITRQVRAGELSVQHGEALMRDLYGSTLKADDPLAQDTQSAWLEANPDQKAAFLSTNTAEKNAAAQSYLSDWWSANMGKPGVTWRAREAASKALAQKTRIGEKAAAVSGGLVDAAGSMIGMLSAPTSMAYLGGFGIVTGETQAFTDAMKNYGRASKNTWRGWEGNRKKWFTAEGKKLFKNFEASGAELRALIPTMDLYAEGIDDPKWKAQYSAAIRKITDAAFSLHNSNSEEGWRMTRADLDPSSNPELAKLVNGAVMTGDTGLLDLYFEALLQDHGTRQSAQYLDELTAGAGRFRAAVIAGSAAPPEEIGIEMLSTILTAGVGKVAFGGVKAAAATERAAAAIGTASRMARFRQVARGLKADFAALGMKTGTAQAPLTRLDKASNTLIAGLKTGAGNSITEAGEEAAMALAEPGATRQSVMEGAGMGALAGFLLGPVIGGPAAIKQASTDGRKRREAAANFAAEYNRIAAGTPGFIPLTPDRAETASFLIDPARRDAALAEAREAAGYLAAAIGAAKEENATPAALDNFSRAQARMAAANDALIEATIDPVEAVNAIQSVPEADRPLVMAALKVAARRPDSLTPEETRAAGSRRTAAGESYFAGNDLSPAGRQSIAQAFPALEGFLGRSAAVPIATPTPTQTNVQNPQGQPGSPAGAQAATPQPPVQMPPVSTGTPSQAGTQPAGAGTAAAAPQGQVVPANVEAAVYEAARAQDSTLPEIPATVTAAFNAGQPVSGSMARTAGVEIPEGYTRNGNTWTPPAAKQDAAPAQPEASQAAQVVKRAIKRFPALKGIVEIAKGAQGSGGVYVVNGKVMVNPADLEADLAGYPTEQAKQARIDAVIEEEIVHVAQIRAALQTGKSVEAVYSAIWKDFTAAQQKAAAEAYQGNFTSLNDWQKGAETVRMLVQLRMSGTQTELSKAFSTSVPQSLIDLLKSAVAILREFLATGEVPASVQRAIDATEAMLAEMTAVEATTQPTAQETTQAADRFTTTEEGGTSSISYDGTLLWEGPTAEAPARLETLRAAENSPIRITGLAVGEASERYNLDRETARELEFAIEDLASIMEGMPVDQRRPFIEQAIEEWVEALGIAKKQAEEQAEASKDADRRARSKAAREAAKSRLRDKARAILNSDTYPALSAAFQRGRITPKPNAVGLIIARRKAGKKLTEKEMGILRNLSDFDGMPRKQDFAGGGNNVLAREIIDLLYARQGEGQMPNVIADKLTPSIDTASEMFEAIGRELNALANGKQMVDRLDDPNHEWTDAEIAEFEARRETQAAQEQAETAPEPQPYATASDIHGFAIEAFGPEAEFTEKLGAIADFADRFPRDVMPLIRQIIGIEFARHVDGLSIPEWSAQNGGEFTADGKFFLQFLRTNTAAEVRAKLGQMPVMDEVAPLASSPTVAPFYSQLSRAIEAKMPKAAPVAQVLAIARDGAKNEEIKWSGLMQAAERLAAENGGKVPKDSLLAYLADEGSVRFEEVTFGGEKMVFRNPFPTQEALMANIDGDEGIQKPNGELKPGLRIVQTEEGWNLADSKESNDAKFGQHVLPGGENYREVVLAMPDASPSNVVPSAAVRAKYADQWAAVIREHGGFSEQADALHDKMVRETVGSMADNYTSTHFPDVPNYVAHMRTNERDGGLFIEELQSDRHQAGRKQGYKEDMAGTIPDGYTLIDENQDARNAGYDVPEDASPRWRYQGPNIASRIFDKKEDAIADMWRHAGASLRVPDAPFRTTWPLALFKRALRDAVASGKEWIGFTTGRTQSDRFDLSKQIRELAHIKNENGTYDVIAVTLEDEQIVKQGLNESQLEDFIGKEVGQKVVNGEGSPSPASKMKVLSGLDLKTESKGMIGFYDNMLPKEIGKYVKQWGGKVEKAQIETPPFSDDKQADDIIKQNDMVDRPIWRIDITPAMREGVSQGQALFSSPTPQSEFGFNQTTDAGDARQIGLDLNATTTDGPGRTRPKTLIAFEKPYRGPSGSALVAYEWKHTMVEETDKRGEDVVRRVSDWNEATTNWQTGREIVHQFYVEDPAGQQRIVSLETAIKLLGYTKADTKGTAPVKKLGDMVKRRGLLAMEAEALRPIVEANNALAERYERERAKIDRERMPAPVFTMDGNTPIMRIGALERWGNLAGTRESFERLSEYNLRSLENEWRMKEAQARAGGRANYVPGQKLSEIEDRIAKLDRKIQEQSAIGADTAHTSTAEQAPDLFNPAESLTPGTMERFVANTTQAYQKAPEGKAKEGIATIAAKREGMTNPGKVTATPQRMLDFGITGSMGTKDQPGLFSSPTPNQRAFDFGTEASFNTRNQMGFDFGAKPQTPEATPEAVGSTQPATTPETRPLPGTSPRGKSAVQNLWDWASDASASIDPRAPQGNLFDTTPKTSNTQTNDIPSRPNLEPDRPGASAPDQGGDAGLQNDRPATGSTRRPLDEAGATGADAAGGGAMPADMPSPDGGGAGNAKPRGQKSKPAKRDSGDQQPGGSRQTDGGGLEPQRPGPEDTRPNLIPATTGIESLAPSSVEGEVTPRADGWVSPLTPEQKGDVVFVEARLYGANKSGVLLTNGTGTGKTFSGLGVIKQALDRGAKHILVVAPSDGVGMAWKRTANNFFDIQDAAQLTDTKDNGKGNRLVFATYANLGQNNTLIERPWDLIVADEAHYLSQSKQGKETDALDAVRALTWHKSGMWDRAAMLHPEEKQVLEDGEKIPFRERSPFLKNRMADASGIIDNTRRRLVEEQKQRITEQDRPRLMMLSATPFAYHFSLDYAEGYLFDHGPEPTSTAYNTPSARDRFYIENFGYRMRTGKLTQPDAAAATATGILERRFAELLMREKAMSGRALQVDQDYSRQFVLTETEVGRQIDQIMKTMRENPEFAVLNDYIALGDYLARRYLFEGIKAREAVARVKQHLALGRKVVVFHDYKKGGAFNPLIPVFHKGEIVEKWNQETGKYERVNLRVVFEKLKRAVPFYDQAARELNSLLSPIEVFTRNFPEGGIYNGSVPKARRRAIVDEFNTSGSMMNVILVQRASGKEGISLHDTDKKHQRAFIDIGFASRPTDAIQGEGRIYRHGVQSDAVVEYLTTGTDAERMTFAETIARRSSTAENLAMGERARTLLQSFASGYNDAEAIEPSLNQGKGGKEMDRAMEAGTSYKTAVALFYTNQKKTSRNKSSEGTDYFATPEPVGFKMVEWADIQAGEKVLEPSGGHGAIARFFPDATNRHAVEPSMELAGRLALNATDTTIHNQRFEDFNIINKFNAVVMNPPFGTAGKTAMDHLEKALGHLKNGGRVVALIPEGSSMQKRFDKWYESKEADPYFIRAEIKLPTSTFERAGTSVSTRILVIDKLVMPKGRDMPTLDSVRRDLSNAESFEEFIDRLEFVNVPPRPEVEAEAEESTEDAAPNIMTGGRDFILPSIPRPEVETTFSTAEFPHSKTGATMFVAKLEARLSKGEYAKVAASAKAFGGWYSSYAKDGAIPGFLFKSAEARDVFVGGASGQSDTTPTTLYSSPSSQGSFNFGISGGFNTKSQLGFDFEGNATPKPEPQTPDFRLLPTEDKREIIKEKTKAKAAERAGITDFGEKIGGARKDMVLKSEEKPRPKKTSNQPGWFNRYEVNEVVASTGPVSPLEAYWARSASAETQPTREVGRFVINDKRKTDWKGNPIRATRQTFATREEAEAFIPVVEVSRNHRVRGEKDGETYRFAIWRDITDRKRVQVVKQTFDTEQEAREFMVKNAADIIETKTSWREELIVKPENAVRKGPERRKGPATPEMFQEAFGFRGVEFGNWMRQAGDGKERQEVLNHAYDGLLDLAELVGIPPRAISLNGDLGLAFGARGQGLSGAKAHYEPDYVVINLTKMSGAGSLAHEWIHALDHYFGRQDGRASSQWVKNSAGDMVLKTGDFEKAAASGGFSRQSDVRPEVRESFIRLMDTVFNKAVEFVEDSESAERFVATSRKALEEELAKLRKDYAREPDARYEKRRKQANAAQLALFDSIADRLVNGQDLETEWRTIEGTKARYGTHRWTNDALEQLGILHKEITNRQGFNAEHSGPMNDLRGYMARYHTRIKMLQSAAASETKVKRVPTNFSMNAKRIDQGSASDYWNVPHEMLARAFSAYVEDRIADTGGTSDFLSYGSDNNLPLYRQLNVKPFPEGAERENINQAFDELFQVIKTKETDKGIALYSSPTPQQPDLFTVATAPGAAKNLGSVRVGRMNALAAYRALTGKRNAGKALTADEEQKLLDAEQALGQKLAFDMDGLATQGSSKLPPRTDNIFDDILGMIRPMKFDNEATRRVKNIIWRAIDMATQAPAERAKFKTQFARTIQKGKGVEVFDKGQLETLLEEQFAYDADLLKAAWDMEAATDNQSLTTQPVALQGPMTPKKPQATMDDGGGIFGADRSFLQTKDGQMGLFSSPTPMPIPPPSTAFERAAIRVSEITGSKSGTRQNDKFDEFFKEELAKDDAYDKALAEWVNSIPENKPITFISATRDTELPSYYTVTKNASDPERPWRTTYFNTQRRPDWTIEEEIEYEELFKKTRWYSNSPEWNQWNDRLYELGSRPTTTNQTRIVPSGHEETKTRAEAAKHAASMAGNMDAKVGALFSSPTSEVSAAIQQALEQMPTKYREVYQDIQSGMEPLAVVAKHKISEKGLTNILKQVRARLATATAAATSGLNPVMRGDKFLGGRPDLALSTTPEITAVDQMRNESDIPDVRPWDEVFARAADMLAADYQGTYDMLLAKARDLQPMTDLEVAASKMIISRETMAGKITEPADRVKLGMMIYGYREIGTETARSLAIRRDPHLTPAERHAQFIAEALFTPDTATRTRMKKNPSNAEAILAGWMKRVDTIEAELRAQGIDIRASLAEFNARKEGVAEASAENPQTKAIIEETFRRLTRREKAVIEAIRGGALATKAAFLTGMSVEEVLQINGQFVKDIKAAMSEAAKRFLAQSLASSPSNNAMDAILAELGIYDNSMIDDTQPDFVDRRNEKPRAPRKRRAPKETPADGTATAPATPKAPKKPAAPFVPNLTPEQQAALDEAWKRWIDSPLSPWKAFQDEMGILYWTQKQADEFMAKAEGIKRDWTKMKDLFEEREKINETTGTFDTEATNTEGTLFPQPVNETTGTFDLNDPLAMKQVIDAFALARGTKMDALMEFWRMSILTGPQTHVVNTASNLMNLAFNLIPRRAAEASINGVLGLVGQSDPTSATFREFGPMLANLRAGASLAARNGLRAWKMESRGLFESYAQAQALQMEFSGVGTEYIPPALGGKLGRIMRSLSFRAMTAADEFMKSIYGQMEAAAHAHRIAREEEKLTGDAYGERIAQLMIPGSTAWIRAVDGSRRVTFQEEMDGSDPAAIRRIDQLAELVKKGRVMPWLGRPITFLIPFVDTPTNIFKQALQYTPIGGGLALIDMARALRRRIASNGLTPEEARAEAAQLYDRARLVQDMTNQAIGLMVWMALDGLVGGEDDEELPFITGTIPFKSTRKGERDNAFAVMPAMSIRIGGLQFSYSRFEPFATVLAGMADLRVEMNRRGGFKPEVVSEFLMRFKDQINEKTFLQGVSNLLNAIEDPDRFAERLAANVATGFVPNFIRQPIREVTGTLPDTNPRADDGFFTAVAKRVGYSIVPQAAPERLSAWGEEIPTNRGEMIGGNRGTDAAFRIFDPTNATLNPDIDPIDRWIYQWNLQTADSKDRVAIEPIGNSITGKVPGEKRAQQFPLTVEEQAEANRNAGRMARAMLGQDWQGRELTEESAKAIKDAVSQAQDFERRRLRQIKIAQAMANPE